MSPTNPRLSSFLAGLAVVLAGCGGGGGGGGGAAGGGGSAPGGTQGSTGVNSVKVLTVQSASLAADDAVSFDPASTLGGGIPAGAVPIAFRKVDAGSSSQGSPSGALGAQPDEPLATVSVDAFFLSTFEITQRQWTALATAAGFSALADLEPWTQVQPAGERAPADGADIPAYGLGFAKVQTVLAAWNATVGASGPQLRLPTGREWEHACRAGTITRYVWGEQESIFPAIQFALTRETRAAVGVQTVGGARQANGFGFFDMHGNLWEWTSDPPTVLGNVMRGGSWSDNLISARSANRQYLDPAIGYALSGLRLVVVP